MQLLGETPLTTISVSFVKHPNHICSYLGWKVVKNEEYVVDMVAVIILAPFHIYT
mgnify:CR=1 FL=1